MKPAILIAVLAAGFHYFLDFDDKRSIVFAVLFSGCYFGFKELNKRIEKQAEKAEDFIPYRVSVTLHNPHDFLFKYNLIRTETNGINSAKRANTHMSLRV